MFTVKSNIKVKRKRKNEVRHKKMNKKYYRGLEKQSTVHFLLFIIFEQRLRQKQHVVELPRAMFFKFLRYYYGKAVLYTR